LNKVIAGSIAELRRVLINDVHGLDSHSLNNIHTSYRIRPGIVARPKGLAASLWGTNTVKYDTGLLDCKCLIEGENQDFLYFGCGNSINDSVEGERSAAGSRRPGRSFSGGVSIESADSAVII
jgi:hypothetical protein